MKKLAITLILLFGMLMYPCQTFAGTVVDNLSYTLYDAKGNSYSTSASGGNAKVIIFGRRTCGACTYLLSVLSENGKEHKNVDLLYVDYQNPGNDVLKAEENSYPIKNLHYVSGTDAYDALWDYADAYPGAKNGNCVGLPLSFYINADNKIVGVNSGSCDVDQKIETILGIKETAAENEPEKTVTNDDTSTTDDTAVRNDDCPDGNCDATLDVSSIRLLANKAKRKLTVKWTKNSAVDYYELQISTKKSFKNAKTIKVSKNKKSYTKKKLKAGKHYYVRIRGIQGGRHSNWIRANVKMK